MRVVDAESLSEGVELLCFRMGAHKCDPPVVVRFHRPMPKHRKRPAQVFVRYAGGFTVVNVRDVDWANPLERMADALARKGLA